MRCPLQTRSPTRRHHQSQGKHPAPLGLQQRCASLLLEAIIAIGVFALFLGGIGFSLILGERSTISAGDRTTAAFLAEQQLEGIRQMRNQKFSLLTVGTHGMVLTGTGWNFSGGSTVKNGYRSSVTLLTHAVDWIDVTSTVSWNFKNTRSGSVVLHTSITNWRKTIPVGNWAGMMKIAQSTIGGTPDYQKIAITGTYAFITSTNTSGGKGLYVFDITNPASPVRIATSFDLGASAYGLAVTRDRLFLATDNPVAEIQVFDITSPSTLVPGNRINSFDLAGAGKARSIALYGNNIFVGSLDDPPRKQFTSLLMSETGPITMQSSLAMSGSVLDISLHEGYAYAATSYNVGELQVVDIFDPATLVFAPSTGIDLTDVQDANAIATVGSSALLGRLNGASIDELTLYSTAASPVPSPPPGPWTLEVGGDVNALTSIAGSIYGFVGGSTSAGQIRVLDMSKFSTGQAPVVKTYDTLATVNGLAYDWQRDRLYAVSALSLFVFAPS